MSCRRRLGETPSQTTTAEGSPTYVTPGDRIATFDQDGTLCVEHPIYTQAMFAEERKNVTWPIDPATGNAHRSPPQTSAKDLETYGMCHSRRGKFAEPWRPGEALLQKHLPSLLDRLRRIDPSREQAK